MVYEKLIPAVVETEVLDYERASEVIRRSGGGAISLCSCRHKAQAPGQGLRGVAGGLHLAGQRRTVVGEEGPWTPGLG